MYICIKFHGGYKLLEVIDVIAVPFMTLIHTKRILVIFVFEQSDSARLPGHLDTFKTHEMELNIDTPALTPGALWFVTFSVGNAAFSVTSRDQSVARSPILEIFSSCES